MSLRLLDHRVLSAEDFWLYLRLPKILTGRTNDLRTGSGLSMTPTTRYALRTLYQQALTHGLRDTAPGVYEALKTLVTTLEETPST